MPSKIEPETGAGVHLQLMTRIDPTQLNLIREVGRRLRRDPCRLDLGLFSVPDDRFRAKQTLSAWIVETAQMNEISSGLKTPAVDHSESQAGRLLKLTDEEALRLFRVTYWNEPFASACIFSAYEYLDELSLIKFRFSLTDAQEQNSRKVLRLFAYQAVVEICFLRMMFFFATGKTDEPGRFEIEGVPLAAGFSDLDDLWKRVEHLRRVPVEKVNEIIRCKHRGWLFGSFDQAGLSAGRYF